MANRINRRKRGVSIFRKLQRAAGGGIAVWTDLLNGLLRVVLKSNKESRN
jgi:hypothetical protein